MTGFALLQKFIVAEMVKPMFSSLILVIMVMALAMAMLCWTRMTARFIIAIDGKIKDGDSISLMILKTPIRRFDLSIFLRLALCWPFCCKNDII